MPNRYQRQSERGASLTEFAIVMPLFVALTYGSLYLCDAGVFRVRALEIARYGAWALSLKPLSSYGTESFDHQESFSTAQTEVIAELGRVYTDLDGSRSRTLLNPIVTGTTMTALFVPPTASDLRNRELQLVPEWGNPSFSAPLSGLWWVLQLLQVGGDVNDVLVGPTERMKLNAKGQVTSTATLTLLPPLRPADAARMLGLARLGKDVGADLSRFVPAGWQLRDRAGRDIQATLLADSWRVSQGWSANPGATTAARDDTHFVNIVKQVSQHGLEALPLGPILTIITALAGMTDRLPDQLKTALASLTGVPPEKPEAHVFSRPYSDGRLSRPAVDTDTDLAAGQVSIFADTGGTAQEDEDGSPVHKFESGPLYVDPQRPADSDYVRALEKRGPYFMGCDEAQRRGCWEAR
ncbi:MAG: pilus assembly protein [Deltaproteobacteria bacterium]|nr:pilus assembly protein [Deltaproteobacteria bacterium]